MEISLSLLTYAKENVVLMKDKGSMSQVQTRCGKHVRNIVFVLEFLSNLIAEIFIICKHLILCSRFR